ncbi:myb/SANT-like DNA-binding domain-containing protein 2 isoform X2 [Dunckerocampus dactyliophorus]|nr:myb/SANT-like DNA-binding domain-containing protein 2 isoform X2 [Dunckerocampus dactyliophorus]
MESDSSTLEDFSQEDWCNQVLASAFQEGDLDAEKIQMPRNKTLQIQAELLEKTQKTDMMQTLIRILDSVQLKWEHFQTWTEFSRLHLSNKLAIFGVGYNTRWREDVRYHYAEISSQAPLGKRLREYFNPEKPEGKIIMTKVQKMNWKNVYYKFLDITISEARCLELHMEVDWIPVALSREAVCSMGTYHYLLPGDIPKAYGLYAIGFEAPSSGRTSNQVDIKHCSLPQCDSENWGDGEGAGDCDSTETKVTYCYLGIAEDRTIQQCVFQHFQGSGKHYAQGEPSSVTCFLQENCQDGVPNDDSVKGDDPAQCFAIYIKFIEVDLDFLSAGSLVECLETAIGYSLKYNNKEAF